MVTIDKTTTGWISIIFMVVILTYSLVHLGSWASEPPDVDPINFVMALDHYDISTDRPHPPGYPLYVGLAKISSDVVGKAHAYQFINLTMLLAAAICLFLLTHHYGRPEVGLATVILLITHPLTFSATIVQESYFSDAFFGCLIVTWLLTNSASFKKQLVGVSLIFLTLGLFRIVSCAELSLVAIACVYVTHTTNSLKKAFITALYIASFTLIAYLTTIWLAGGYATYSAATARVMGAAVAGKSILAGAPVKAHAFMLLKFTVWLALVSLPTLLAIGYFLLKHKEKLLHSPKSKELLIVTLGWVLPPIGLYSLFYFLKPTYLMILLPPILLVFSILVFHLFRNQHKKFAWSLVILIASSQLLFFYYAPASLPKPLYRLTHTYFNAQDMAMSELKRITLKENSAHSLLIWVDHPELSIYATRVISWKGQIGLMDSNYKSSFPTPSNGILPIETLEPITMQFGNGVDLNKVEKVLIIENESNQFKYNVYTMQSFLNMQLSSNKLN